jgi:hypothetical protein
MDVIEQQQYCSHLISLQEIKYYKGGGGLWQHEVHIKFHENKSNGSKVISGDTQT